MALPVFYLVHRYAPRLVDFEKIGLDDTSGSIRALPMGSYVYYLCFFLLAGSSLALLTWSFNDEGSYLLMLFTFSVGWTLGFLTPGAPSGIGVRETVMVCILSPMIGPPQAIIVTMLSLVMTVGGDLLSWLLTEVRGRFSRPAE